MRRRKGKGPARFRNRWERCKHSHARVGADTSHEVRQTIKTEAPFSLGAQEEQCHRGCW